MVFFESLECVLQVFASHVLAFLGDLREDIVLEPVGRDSQLVSGVIEVGDSLGSEETILLDEKSDLSCIVALMLI